MALSGVTMPGAIQASSSDLTAFYLTKGAVPLWSAFSQADKTEGAFLEETLDSARDTQEKWYGDSLGKSFARGSNTLVPSHGNALLTEVKKIVYFVRLDYEPMYAGDIVHNFDLRQTPNMEAEVEKLFAVHGAALSRRRNYQRFSTAIQTASMPDPLVTVAALASQVHTKADAEGLAGTGTVNGLTSAWSPSTPGSGVYYISNSTTAPGSSIVGIVWEDVFTRMANYFDALDIPEGVENRQVFMRPDDMRLFLRDAGIKIPIYGTGGSFQQTVTNAANRDLGGTGSVSSGMITEFMGWGIRPTSALYALGTKLNGSESTSAGFSATAGSKYAPGSGYASGATATVYGINGITVPSSRIFEAGLAGSNPVDWNTTAGAKCMDHFNNVRAIFFMPKRACKTNTLMGIKPEMEYRLELLGTLTQAHLLQGHGAIDPRAVAYVCSHKIA